jgi:antitoxin PrlF
MNPASVTQKVTAKGQITLKRELLQHLGIRPGERIALDIRPGGEIRVRAVRGTESIEDFIGLLAGKTDKVATIEEMNEAAGAGWAGEEPRE